MINLIATLALDSIMVLLLIVTIFLCFKLNGRIKMLQDSKSELAQLIAQFDDLTVRATNSIADIHAAGKRINENMQHQLDKANFLADDLSFMIEKGSKLADRMEGKVSGKQTTGRSAGDGAVRGSRRAAAKPEMASEENEIAAAAKSRSKKNAALDEVLQKMSGRKEAKESNDSGKKPTMGVRLRSKAEQELYEGLKEAENS